MKIRKIQKAKFVLIDFLAAFLAWVAFYMLRKNLLGEEKEPVSVTLLGNAFIVASFWIVLYLLLGFYRDIFRKSRIKEIFNIAQISVVGGIIIFFGLLLDDEGVRNYQAYYKTITAYFGIHFFLSAIAKVYIISATQKLILKQVIKFNTLLVGSNYNAREVFTELKENNSHLGLHILGFVQIYKDSRSSFVNEIPNLGYYSELPALIKQYQIEEIIIAIEPSEHEIIQAILSQLEDQNLRISILPDLYQILLGSVRVNHLFGTPLIEIKHDLMPVWQEFTKRTSDILISLFMLLFLMPVYVVLGLMVKCSSKGPIFFGQERIGQHGVPFKIYKFRSMYQDAEKHGPALSRKLDPRITPLGRVIRKIRLDELPQFYNVLVGEMSIVGPRPERSFYIDQIIKVAPHYKHLLRVRPGITSLGLVKFGYAQNVEEMVKRLKYDILYIENMSLNMDFRVLLYTIKVIIEGRGK